MENSPRSVNTDSNSTYSSDLDRIPAKIFVGGLSPQTTPEKLREYFSMFGLVTDVVIVKEPATQRSRGFGFVTFAEQHTVDNVFRVPVHAIDGKKVEPKFAKVKMATNNRHASPSLVDKSNKIFIGGVGQDTAREDVEMYFRKFGKITETILLMDNQTKRHRGFGFVTFENEDVVDHVCEIHFHTIKNKKVECKKALKKELSSPVAQGGQQQQMLAGELGRGLSVASPLVWPPGNVGQLALMQAQAQLQAYVAAGQYGGAVQAAVPGSYRYSPYHNPYPGGAPVAHAHPAHQPDPYQGYNLAGVNMSSFQGVDWNAIHGMPVIMPTVQSP